MHCLSCGQKNPDHARFCLICGRQVAGAGFRPGPVAAGAWPVTSSWTDILGMTALFIIGMAGIYMHPLLEVAAVAYIAVGASTVWVFLDTPKRGMPRWPWTLGTLALWVLVFPIYLWKTRGLRGFIPGLLVALVVVGMQVFPEMYSAKKHFRRGLIFAGQQRLTKAEEEFRAAVKRDAALGEAHLNLGILYMSQGLLDAAEKELLTARDLISQHGVRLIPGTKNQALSLCLANLSAVYAMRTSEAIQILDRADAKRYFAEAQKHADEAVRLDADNVRSVELVRRLQQLSTLLE